MRRIFISISLLIAFGSASAQSIALSKGWKLKIGDSTAWSSTQYNDQGWKDANVSVPWEDQGYDGYDGFGWYRLHVVIPSSLKEKAFLKDSLHFNLGMLDDGAEVYLNDQLVYKNWVTGGIKNGQYGPGSFSVASNNPALLWGKENV